MLEEVTNVAFDECVKRNFVKVKEVIVGDSDTFAGTLAHTHKIAG